jgi:hypothetical protein
MQTRCFFILFGISAFRSHPKTPLSLALRALSLSKLATITRAFNYSAEYTRAWISHYSEAGPNAFPELMIMPVLATVSLWRAFWIFEWRAFWIFEYLLDYRVSAIPATRKLSNSGRFSRNDYIS